MGMFISKLPLIFINVKTAVGAYTNVNFDTVSYTSKTAKINKR